MHCMYNFVINILMHAQVINPIIVGIPDAVFAEERNYAHTNVLVHVHVEKKIQDIFLCMKQIEMYYVKHAFWSNTFRVRP